jgi:hypothetical protein
MPERVEITGPVSDRYVEILALEPLVSPYDALAGERAAALAARRHDVIRDDGPLVTKYVVERMIYKELVKIQELTADSFDTARRSHCSPRWRSRTPSRRFLTLPACVRMP